MHGRAGHRLDQRVPAGPQGLGGEHRLIHLRLGELVGDVGPALRRTQGAWDSRGHTLGTLQGSLGRRACGPPSRQTPAKSREGLSGRWGITPAAPTIRARFRPMPFSLLWADIPRDILWGDASSASDRFERTTATGGPAPSRHLDNSICRESGEVSRLTSIPGPMRSPRAAVKTVPLSGWAATSMPAMARARVSDKRYRFTIPLAGVNSWKIRGMVPVLALALGLAWGGGVGGVPYPDRARHLAVRNELLWRREP